MMSRAQWIKNKWIDQPEMITNTQMQWITKAMTPARTWVSGVERWRLKENLQGVKEV